MNRERDPDVTDESRQSLWLLAAAPTIWAVQLMLSYLTAAIWIEKAAGRDFSLAPVRIAIAAYTAAALIGVSITFWIGYRKHRYGEGRVPHDDDTPEDRHRFLGFATMLLSGLSATAIIFVGLTAIFIRTTH